MNKILVVLLVVLGYGVLLWILDISLRVKPSANVFMGNPEKGIPPPKESQIQYLYGNNQTRK